MKRFRRIWLRLLWKSSIACGLRNSRIWVGLFNCRHNPPMKCRKLYGNHLVKLLSCSHARLSNMNSSEVRMTFSKLVHRPVRRNNDSLWYITCRNTWQLQTTNEIPGKVYSGEYFIVLWTPWNTKNSYFMQFRHASLPRAALTPPLENIVDSRRLVSEQEFYQGSNWTGSISLPATKNPYYHRSLTTRLDNRVLRLVTPNSFRENRKLWVSRDYLSFLLSYILILGWLRWKSVCEFKESGGFALNNFVSTVTFDCLRYNTFVLLNLVYFVPVSFVVSTIRNISLYSFFVMSYY